MNGIINNSKYQISLNYEIMPSTFIDNKFQEYIFKFIFQKYGKEIKILVTLVLDFLF